MNNNHPPNLQQSSPSLSIKINHPKLTNCTIILPNHCQNIDLLHHLSDCTMLKLFSNYQLSHHGNMVHKKKKLAELAS